MKRFWKVLCLAGWMLVLAACGGKERFSAAVETSGITLIFDHCSRRSKQELELQAGEIIKVEIRRDAGKLDLVLEGEGEVVYRGNDAETGGFSVVIPKNGIYTLTFQGKDAAGEIRVEKEGNTEL